MREKCIVRLGAAWSIRRLHWPCSIYGDMASANVTAFILALRRAVQSCCEGSCQGSEFVFIQDVLAPPTANQPRQCGHEVVTTVKRGGNIPISHPILMGHGISLVYLVLQPSVSFLPLSLSLL